MKVIKLVGLVQADVQDLISVISKDFENKEVQIIKLDPKVNVDYLKEVNEFEGQGSVKTYHLDDWSDQMIVVTDNLTEDFDLFLESASNLK